MPRRRYAGHTPGWLCTVVAFALTAPANAAHLDPTFGVGGLVITAAGAEGSEAHDVLVEPDGTLMVAGYISSLS